MEFIQTVLSDNYFQTTSLQQFRADKSAIPQKSQGTDNSSDNRQQIATSYWNSEHHRLDFE